MKHEFVRGRLTARVASIFAAAPLLPGVVLGQTTGTRVDSLIRSMTLEE